LDTCKTTLFCAWLLCSRDCPELQLRHAVRAAIGAGDVCRAEALVRASRYAHLLEPRAAASPAASPAAAAPGGAGPGSPPTASTRASGSGGAAAGSGSMAEAAGDVHLRLSCQKFVELLRDESRISEATDFGMKVRAHPNFAVFRFQSAHRRSDV